MDHAISRNGVPIRLTDERWVHIVENHDEVAGHRDAVLGTIESADVIMEGYGGALVAAKRVSGRKHLLVVYRETGPDDGFVVTAYFAKRIERRNVLWRRQA